jgi:hypothetical protein
MKIMLFVLSLIVGLASTVQSQQAGEILDRIRIQQGTASYSGSVWQAGGEGFEKRVLLEFSVYAETPGYSPQPGERNPKVVNYLFVEIKEAETDSVFCMKKLEFEPVGQRTFLTDTITVAPRRTKYRTTWRKDIQRIGAEPNLIIPQIKEGYVQIQSIIEKQRTAPTEQKRRFRVD